MTIAITPVTAADGSFSTAGAAAWAAGMSVTMGATALLGNNTGAGAVLELTAAQVAAFLAGQATASSLAVPYILSKTGVPTSAGADTTEDTLSSISLPALNANSALRVHYQVTRSGAGGNVVFNAYLGGTGGTKFWTRTQAAGSAAITCDFFIMNANSTGSQTISGLATNSGGTNIVPTAFVASQATGSAGIVLLLTAQKVSAGDAATVTQVCVELLDNGT